MSQLDVSYAVCERLARQSASNFYFSFLLLPREKRRAMYPLYAYLRHVDDLADDDRRDVATRQQSLTELRSRLQAAISGDAQDPVLTALADVVARFHIPAEYLTAAIDGVEMDLHGARYETFADLELYCERVASAVGLACLHIWGFRGPQALEPARRCGLAFQLTNILRDLKEDVASGRVYLPREDLQRFGYRVEELTGFVANDRFADLMQFEINRAEQFYVAAEELEPLLKPDGRRALRAMVATYRKLLAKIKRRPADVFRRRVRLSALEKIRIVAAAVWRRPRSMGAESSMEAVSS